MSVHYEITPYTPDPETHPAAVKLPFLKLGRTQLVDGSVASYSHPALATVTFKVPLSATESQRSLLLPGACPMLYDGKLVHEAGFHTYPEGLRLVATAGGGTGHLVNGTYGVCAMYEWLDARGVTHRSGGSVPVSITLAGADNEITVRCPHARNTGKQVRAVSLVGGVESGNPVRLVIFRTVLGGTVYYRTDVTTNNNPFATDDASIVLGSGSDTDLNLVKNELLPTTGGGLDAEAFPSATIACQHQRRTFFVTQEEQSYLQYTDETDERFLAQQTNEVYRIPIPTSGGSVVGLASMDEKLIIFCQRRIFFVFGEGPNRLGQQNGYSLPQICSSSLGMAGGFHTSLALTPEGLWFMASTLNLRLLSRDLSIREEQDQDINYYGSDVDGLIGPTITSARACVIDSKNQVRWYLSDSTVITWDYAQKQWSRQTNHNSTGGAVSARGLFWHSNGTDLFSSNAAAGGLDDATVTPQVLESAWLKLADVQGYQRAYSFMLLAQAMSTGTIQIEEGFNYRETFVAPTSPQYTLVPALMVVCAAPFSTIPATLSGGSSGTTGTVLSSTLGDVPGDASPDPVALIVTGAWPHNYTVGESVVGVGFFGTVSSVTQCFVYTDTSALGATTILPGDVLTELTDVWQFTNNTTNYIAPTSSDAYLLLRGTFSIGTWELATPDVVTLSRPFIYTVAGAQNPLQVEHRLSYQQCESFRFRLTITPGSTAEFLRLTSFALSIGMKRGLFKLPSAQRF